MSSTSSLRNDFEMVQEGKEQLKDTRSNLDELKFENQEIKDSPKKQKASSCQQEQQTIKLNDQQGSEASDELYSTMNDSINLINVKTENENMKTGNESLEIENESLKTDNGFWKIADVKGKLEDDSDELEVTISKCKIDVSGKSDETHEQFENLKPDLENGISKDSLLSKNSPEIAKKDAKSTLNNDQLVEIQRTVTTLQQVFQMTQEEKTELKENVKSLKLKIERLDRDLSVSRNENESLRTIIEENKSAHKKTDSQLLRAIREREQLEKQVDKILKEKFSFELENRNQLSTMSHMFEHISRLEKNLETQRSPWVFDLEKIQRALFSATEERENVGLIFALKIRLDVVEMENANLKKELHEVKAKNVEFKSRNKALVALLEKTPAKAESLEKTDTVESMIRRKATEIENALLKEHFETMNTLLLNLGIKRRDDVVENNLSIAFTVSKISQLEEELKRDKAKHDRLIAEKRKTKETFEKQKRALEKQLSDEKAKNVELVASAKKSLETENRTLMVKNDQLEDENAVLLDHNRYFESEVTALSFENKQLRIVNAALKEEKSKLAQERDLCKREVATTNKTLQREITEKDEALRQHKESLKREIQKKEREIQNKERELQNKERDMSAELDDKFKVERQKWKQSVADQKKAWQNEKQRLLEDNRAVENQLQTKLRDIENLKVKFSSLEEEKTLLEEKFNAYQLEVQETDHSLEINRARETIDALNEDLRLKNLEIIDVKEALNLLRKEHEEEIRALEETVTKGEKKLSTFKSKGKKLLETLKADKEKLEGQNAELKKENEILGNRIKFEMENFKQQLAAKEDQIKLAIKNSFKDEASTWMLVAEEKEKEVKLLNEESDNKESVIKAITADVEGLQLRNSMLYAELEAHRNTLSEWITSLSPNEQVLFVRDSRSEKVITLMKKKLQNLQKTCVNLAKFDKYATSDCYSVIREFVDAELNCVICSDLIRKAITLSCTHSFCETCLGRWKQSKRDCPMCRTPIKFEARTTVIDNVIEKLLECFPKQHVIEASVSASGDVYASNFPTLSQAALNL